MKNSIKILGIMLALAFVACNNRQKVDNENIKLSVTANGETDLIKAAQGEDAADDPAIWIHPGNSALSTIIGTNKKGGLAVYDLSGKELFYYEMGNINNVDVLYDYVLGNDTIDLVGFSNRKINSVGLKKVNKANRSLEDVQARDIVSAVKAVYGFCMYRSPKTGTAYAFINSKDGQVEQWELIAKEGAIDAQMLRSFDVGGQVEGMVADAETAQLYVGEEGGGIWKYGAEPEDGEKRRKLLMSDENNPAIKFDVEGLSIYYAANGKGYLIASSQGNYSYAVFEREGNNKYLFSFKISDGALDGAEETDGLDVSNRPLGKDYPYGLFVVQDGFNKDENGTAVPQNFKMVGWEKIAKLVQPELIVDTGFVLYR